jgi:hypothetical protein
MLAKAGGWVDGDTGEWHRVCKYPQGCKARRASRLRNRALFQVLGMDKDIRNIVCLHVVERGLIRMATACVPLAGRVDQVFGAISGCKEYSIIP